jgi:hypothetical protein
MSYVTGLTIVALAAVLWVGCGSDDEPEPSGSGPLVVYQKSGGVAGILERLRVERDGSATVTVGFDGSSESFRLSEAELEQLESELGAADLSVPPGPPGCADCFEYEVSFGGETARFDQLAEPSEPLGALLAHLARIVASHQPAQAGAKG